MLQYLLMVLLFLTAALLIVLILLQRGKGGGLAGALGGLGGQSAFGTKAGDLFTRITIGVATFWILLCIFAVWRTGTSAGLLDSDMGTGGAPKQGQSAPAKSEAPAGGASGGAPAAPATLAEKPESKP
jgi:preprotein translocase subunit SecG